MRFKSALLPRRGPTAVADGGNGGFVLLPVVAVVVVVVVVAPPGDKLAFSTLPNVLIVDVVLMLAVVTVLVDRCTLRISPPLSLLSSFSMFILTPDDHVVMALRLG